MVSKDIQHLQKLLENEAAYIVYESGQVIAYLSAEVPCICAEVDFSGAGMDFSAYPRDKHKCAFFIYSPIYVKVTSDVIVMRT